MSRKRNTLLKMSFYQKILWVLKYFVYICIVIKNFKTMAKKQLKIIITKIKIMKAKAKYVETPVGKFPFPMNPAFSEILENCKTDEDLFKLVENENGFTNPDAFTELNARGLYHKYQEWKRTQSQYYVQLRYIHNFIIHAFRTKN